jgi:rubrerythrin
MSKMVFAIQMEVDGEQYYLNQAEKNKDNALQHVFELLARSERKHAELLGKVAGQSDLGSVDDQASAEIANLFSTKDDFVVNPASIPDQVDVYQEALAMEQKSIDLYQGMLQEAPEGHEKKLLAFLVKQEQIHYLLFGELIRLLKRPKDWVESAEFGKREEY